VPVALKHHQARGTTAAILFLGLSHQPAAVLVPTVEVLQILAVPVAAVDIAMARVGQHPPLVKVIMAAVLREPVHHTPARVAAVQGRLVKLLAALLVVMAVLACNRQFLGQQHITLAVGVVAFARAEQKVMAAWEAAAQELKQTMSWVLPELLTQAVAVAAAQKQALERLPVPLVVLEWS
jgi:hypothetical protein